ncbi:MAG: hypothetical protein QM500_01195, partial [Methylococcales bacterium]
MNNNNDLDSYYQSALQFISCNSLDRAISKLNKCIALDIEYSDALLLLAQLHIQKSQLDTALVTYTKARTIKKFTPEAIAGISRIQRLQGNTEKAYNFISDEIKSRKSNVAIIISFSEICIELGLYSDAIGTIEDLLNNNDNCS